MYATQYSHCANEALFYLTAFMFLVTIVRNDEAAVTLPVIDDIPFKKNRMIKQYFCKFKYHAAYGKCYGTSPVEPS